MGKQRHLKNNACFSTKKNSVIFHNDVNSPNSRKFILKRNKQKNIEFLKQLKQRTNVSWQDSNLKSTVLNQAFQESSKASSPKLVNIYFMKRKKQSEEQLIDF